MWNWTKKLDELCREYKPTVIVTVIKHTGSTPRDAGAKMLVLKNGSFFGTIGGGVSEKLALEEAAKVFAEGKTKTVQYDLTKGADQLCGGKVEVLFEPVNLLPSLYIFGAGHVGQALCRTMSGTPFDIHVIDDREEWINSKEIPTGVSRHKNGWEKFVDEAHWSKDETFVAIMTHSHEVDIKILEQVIKKQTYYLGQIASKAKWKEFQKTLKTGGASESRISKVHAPIGLSIGGKSPQEIAISVGSEIIQEYYKR